MRFFHYLRELDKKFSIGLILAVVFGVLAVYLGFVYERKPHLTIDVLSNTAVLDVREPLGDLDIIFKGIDIAASNQSLRIILVRLANVGQLDVLIDRYDPADPLGFRIGQGQIVQPPEITETSNDYLRDNIRLRLPDQSTVEFEPLIIETGQGFTLKLLVLVEEGTVPTVLPIGKVAGIPQIPVQNSFLTSQAAPFLSRAFSGDLAIHTARLIAYTAAGLALLLGILFASFAISDLSGKFRRRRLVKAFSRKASLPPSHDTKQLFKLYVDEGQQAVLSLDALTRDPQFLLKRQMRVSRRVVIEGSKVAEMDLEHMVPDYHGLASNLQVSGLVERTPEGHFPTPAVATILPDFISFLRSKNAIDEAALRRLTRRKPPRPTRKQSKPSSRE